MARYIPEMANRYPKFLHRDSLGRVIHRGDWVVFSWYVTHTRYRCPVHVGKYMYSTKKRVWVLDFMDGDKPKFLDPSTVFVVTEAFRESLKLTAKEMREEEQREGEGLTSNSVN